MAVVPITKVSLPHTNAGYNLTDSASFTVMGTGSGNGVSFAWTNNDIVVLKNTTGGAAVYTTKLGPFASITGYGGTVTDPTNSVAAAKTEIMRLDSQFQDADGNVIIECDVAGSILVLTP